MYVTEYIGNSKDLNLACRNIFSHFSMAGHDRFLNDVSIMFIDKTDPSDPLWREDYWRQTLKTMVPHGLNIELVLSVYIFTSVVVSILSLLPLILLSL